MVKTATTRAAKVSTLLVTSLGSFMVLLDGSIVLVALPTIQQDLHAQVADLQWTVDAYTVPFAALMLTAGTLGDRLGRKKVFLAGLLLFLVGSVVCGFSSTFGVLILGRVIQGLGAAAISTGSLALLVSTFTQPAERAKAIGIWTAVSGVSLAAGPLVGGLLIEAFSWPAIFFINLPIGLLALVLGVPKLLESSNPQARSIDLPGQIAVTGALFCIVMGLIEGPRAGWGSGLIIALFTVGAILLIGFIGYESRAREPMLPMDLFKKPSFSTACVSAGLLGFIIVGVMFFMAQFLQGVQGNTALGAGLRLLPLTLGIFIMSPPAARITGKVGPRPPITVGALLSGVGFLLLTQVNPDTGYASILWRLLLVGLGIGCMFAPLTVAIMAATPPNRGGLGSSMINTFRIVGFTAGAAVLGTVVLSRFSGNITNELSQRGVPSGVGQDVIDRIASAGAFASSSPVSAQLPIGRDELTEALRTAFTSSIHLAFVISAICMFVTAGLAIAFLGGRPQAMPGGPGAAGGPGAPGAVGGPGAAGGPGAPAVGPTAQPAPVGLSVPPLVESEWLADRLGAPNLVVIDCTVQHHAPPTGGIQLHSGLPGYREGHIPGAHFADLMTEFANPGSPKPFALPTQAAFTAALRSLGVDDGDHIVVYDRAHTAWATRFWWMLQVFGVDNVSVLDGGWTKWTAEHRSVATDVPAPSTGTVTLHARPQLVASAADVQAATTDPDTCLINALSPDQHHGRVPVAHGRSGHIESSVNVPAVALIDPATGAFRTVPELRAMFGQVGALQARSVIAYCAAGVNATSDAFALKLIGGPAARVYDGGLAEWSADPELPLVVTAAVEV